MHESYLTFFTDVAHELSKSVPIIQVPFAFSRPSFLRVPSVRKVGFIGEVDISGDCFQEYGEALAERAIESAAKRSEEIVKGQLHLDAGLLNPPHEIEGDFKLLNTWKWSVNNWVRWRLVVALSSNFPNQIDLRGNDWIKHGYPAKKSRFNPIFREYAYRRNVVSLDFGSKSTTDYIYPRASEIIVNHGGLLQLKSGSEQPNLISSIDNFQFKNEEQMLEKIDERFKGKRKIWKEMDSNLADEFLKLRKMSSDCLLESLHDLTRT
jgi:hypothetical protein